MKHPGYVASVVALLVLAEPAALDAAGTDNPAKPIGQVLGVRGGLTELPIFSCTDGNAKPGATVRAELLSNADILTEENKGMLKVKVGSDGQPICLDRRQLVTTLHRSDAKVCDPVTSVAPGSKDLRSQGLGNSGCR